MRISTERTYRLIIPQEMKYAVARAIPAYYFAAPIFISEGDPFQAENQISAVIKAVADKDGLLAAMLTQEIQIEIHEIIKDLTENTIEFKKELVNYNEFLER